MLRDTLTLEKNLENIDQMIFVLEQIKKIPDLDVYISNSSQFQNPITVELDRISRIFWDLVEDEKKFKNLSESEQVAYIKKLREFTQSKN